MHTVPDLSYSYSKPEIMGLRACVAESKDYVLRRGDSVFDTDVLLNMEEPRKVKSWVPPRRSMTCSLWLGAPCRSHSPGKGGSFSEVATSTMQMHSVPLLFPSAASLPELLHWWPVIPPWGSIEVIIQPVLTAVITGKCKHLLFALLCVRVWVFLHPVKILTHWTNMIYEFLISTHVLLPFFFWMFFLKIINWIGVMGTLSEAEKK